MTSPGLPERDARIDSLPPQPSGATPLSRTAKILCALGIIALLVLVALWMEHQRMLAGVHRAHAELRAKGERISIAEVVPRPLGVASNSGPAVLHAVRRLTRRELFLYPSPMQWVAPGAARVVWREEVAPIEGDKGVFIEDAWPEFSAQFAFNREPLELASAALAEKPHCAFTLDYSKGFELLLPHLIEVKKLVSWLSPAVSHDLRFGDPAAGWRHLLGGAHFIERWNQEPMLISQLVRIACSSIFFRANWEALHYPGWTEAQLAELQRIWTNVDWPAALETVFILERAFGLDWFDRTRRNPRFLLDLGTMPSAGSGRTWWEELWDDPAKKLRETGIMVAWPLWVSGPDEENYLDIMGGHIAAARAARKSQSFASTATLLAAASTRAASHKPWFLMSGMLAESFDRVHLRFALAEVSREMLVTAIALRRFQLRHGAYPEELKALVPEFLPREPRDFMDGGTLRYERLPTGDFRLWSAGENGVDDGGDLTPMSPSESDQRNWLRGADIVWPRPATAEELAQHLEKLRAKLGVK